MEQFNRSQMQANEQVQGSLTPVAIIFDRYSNMIRAMERLLLMVSLT
jgi:hypothetical protein